jgi:predicted membrane protein
MTVGILLCLAASADFSTTYLLKLSGNITVFMVSGAIYSALVAVVIYKFPEILGMRRENIISFIRGINFRNSSGTV